MILKQSSLFLLLFLLFLSPITRGQELDHNSPEVRDQIKKMLKRAYRDYKKERKKGKQIESDQKLEFRLGELTPSACVNCREILALSSGVNDILSHMSEQLPIEHQQKISELLAVDVYTQTLHQLNEQDCHRQKIYDLTDEFLDYDIDQAVVLHSQEMKLDHLISFRLQGRTQLHQTIFLRGQGEQSNQLIRVDLHPEKAPFLTVYELNPKTNPPVKYALQDEKNKASLPDFSENRPQMVQTKPQISEQEEPPQDNLRYFEYESDSHGLPKKITILEFKNETQITEDVLLKSDVEISTSEQELVTQITDKTGRQYARFILDKNTEMKAVVPYDFKTFDTDWQGEVQVDKEGITSFVNLNHSTNSKTRIGYTSSIGMTTIEHTRQINTKNRLTIRLSDGQRGEQSVTLNYQMAL